MMCLCISSAIIFIASGCEKKNEFPELLDPIYNDLQDRYNEARTQAIDSAKNIDVLKKINESSQTSSSDIKLNNKEILKTQRELVKQKQAELYYKIRLERRKLLARQSYDLAYSQHKPWPNQDEYKLYMVNQRLKEAPRDWSKHLPRSTRPGPTFVDPIKEGPTTEEAKGE